MNLFFILATVILSIFISAAIVLLFFNKEFKEIYHSNMLNSSEHLVQNVKLDIINENIIKLMEKYNISKDIKIDYKVSENEIYYYHFIESSRLIESNINENNILSNKDIKYEMIVKKYISILKFICTFIKIKQIESNVNINQEALKAAIIDYYIDINKVRAFNNIKKIDISKEYAYMAYWILRRKPIQIVTNFNGCESINELFVTAFILSRILNEKDIRISETDKKVSEQYMNFQKILFYNLKYRNYSQQSLELMIEACSI